MRCMESIPNRVIAIAYTCATLRDVLLNRDKSAVPLADRAIGNLQQLLIGTYHAVSKPQLQEPGVTGVGFASASDGVTAPSPRQIRTCRP
jgi:hypothetical protein